MSSVLIGWMLNLTNHKTVGVGLERAQAGAGAEVDALAAIQGAGVAVRVFDFAAAGCEEFLILFRQWLFHLVVFLSLHFTRLPQNTPFGQLQPALDS